MLCSIPIISRFAVFTVEAIGVITTLDTFTSVSITTSRYKVVNVSIAVTLFTGTCYGVTKIVLSTPVTVVALKIEQKIILKLMTYTPIHKRKLILAHGTVIKIYILKIQI